MCKAVYGIFYLDKLGSSLFTPGDDTQSTSSSHWRRKNSFGLRHDKNVQDKDLLGELALCWPSLLVMLNMLSWKPSMQIDKVMSLLTRMFLPLR
jgi:hypothetical protein